MRMTTNGTQSTLEQHTEVPGELEPDWVLAGVPDGINATGLLAEDLEDGGKGRKFSEISNCRLR